MLPFESALYTRELGLYSDQYLIMYVAAAAALTIFLWGLFRRYGSWKLGAGRLRDRMDRTGARLFRLLKGGVGQVDAVRERLPGWSHVIIAAGFAVFTVGTLTIAVEEHLGLSIFRGRVYLVESLLMDLAGVLGLGATALLFWRRAILKPDGLKRRLGDFTALFLLGLILLSGLSLEGVRMALEPDPAPLFSPAGAWLARIFEGAGEPALRTIHATIWWGHLAAAFAFIALIPWTGLVHIAAAPLNKYLARLDDDGSLVTLDFEKEETFGVLSVRELHRRQLLELDACMECGRCQRACPAHLSGKPLSPEQVGSDLGRALKRAMEDGSESVELVKEHGNGSEVKENGFLSDETLWSCTTCRACEKQCPVDVEHIRRIVDMRRGIVMMRAQFPEEIESTFRNLETSGNPWKFHQSQRSEWTDGLDIPVAGDGDGPITILWTGCIMSLDEGSRSAVRAVAGLLTESGVDFKVLGREELCCGDPARRLGNEYLYQELARKNIEILKRRNVERIITPCPHCRHVLSEEYPDLGLEVEVVHHGQLIPKPDKSGSSLTKFSDGHQKMGNVAFHEPCYLARYHDGTDYLRHMVEHVAGNRYTALERYGEKTFCCGSGGGRFWMDDEPETRINAERCREIIESGADVVVTACPYCRIMISNGMSDRGAENVTILDLGQYLGSGEPADRNAGG